VPAFDMKGVVPELRDAALFAASALDALGREESLGRRARRLREPGPATWQAFRGRLAEHDLLLLLLEDAAVTQPFAFDAPALLGVGASALERLADERVAGWLAVAAAQEDGAEPLDYLTAQARRLGLVTRLARSDLPRSVRPHHRVLELPGTGGQLSMYLAQALPELYLRDVFVVAWSTWRDRMLAGLSAVEAGLTGSAPVWAEAGVEGVRRAGLAVDFVVGAAPERQLQPYDEALLASWFPSARVVLV
jgi:hypothetical protein